MIIDVLAMLFDAASVRDVLERLDKGFLRGKIVIVMSTMSHNDSLDLCHRVEALEGEYVESPVLGNAKVAANAALQVMVGAKKEQMDKVRTLLSTFGRFDYL